jgi:peptidoglycan/LPS O-acetylase OafA/YrhL
VNTLKLELGQPASGRLGVLDELKGLAIILVVAYHFCGAVAWPNTLHGDLGVDMFVILSGAGLAYGSRHEGAGRFLFRRFARVMPTYWVVLALFCVGDVLLLQRSYTVWNLAIHFLGIQALFGDACGLAINDSFWFVTLILLLYALYCAVQPLWGAPDRLLLAGMAASVAVAMAFFYTGQASMFSHLGLRLPGFFVGLMVGRMLRPGGLEIRLGWPLALALVCVTYVPYTMGVIFYTPYVAMALMAAYAFGLRTVAASRLGSRPAQALGFLGRHSLEIFLIHQPLMRQYNVYVQSRWLGNTHLDVGSIVLGMIVSLGVTIYASVELRRLMARIPVPAKGTS